MRVMMLAGANGCVVGQARCASFFFNMSDRLGEMQGLQNPSGMGLPCAEVAVLAEANDFSSAMNAC